jgi:oxygen-independent coproporphyrinogen-3 oxidase
LAGLYLHIPFCERKCIYCSFYSVETLDAKERFLRALITEIELRADALEGDPNAPAVYETIFFGGGTPSLLSPEELERIMRPLRRRFTIAEDAEFTMECNPGAFTREWLEGYRALGVNRISFGVQSFHDDDLQFLSRIHSADEARASIRQAHEVFDNVSLDLIFALPGQTRERWRSNLEEAMALDTPHISAYSLIFEEGTPLNAMRIAGTVSPVSDSLDADMYEETMETLMQHGLRQYEVSNYAISGRECRHNLGYWDRRSYISFGPSAHGFLHGTEVQERWANLSNLTTYLNAVEAGNLPVASRESLSSQLVLEEVIFLGLRSRGIMLPAFRCASGVELIDIARTTVTGMIDGGYACVNGDRLSLTPKGYPFADRFALELINAAEHLSSNQELQIINT